MTPGTATTEPGSQARLLGVLAYAGGLISGAIILAIEKRDAFVRFHAMQSVVTFTGVLVAHLILTGLPVVGAVLSVPFAIAVAILWVILMVRALRGERYKLPSVGDFAEHLLA